MVLVHQRVHLGHADHLKMFEKAPACAVCKSPKLFGLCNCDNKRAREVNAKPRSKKPRNSEVVPNLLSAETELVNLQDMIQSHSEQFVNPNDGTKGNKESNGSKKEVNNNLQSSGAVIDAVIDAVIGASDPFHQIWNKKTVFDVTKNKSINICKLCSDVHAWNKQCKDGVHQGAILVNPLSFSSLKSRYEAIVHDERKVYISHCYMKQLLPSPLSIPDVKVLTKNNLTVNCQQITISSLFGYKIDIPSYVARGTLRAFVSKQYEVEFVKVKQSFFKPDFLRFTKGMFIIDCQLVANESFGHLICYNSFKKVLYVGDNSYVKIDSEEDHSKVMANLGLKVGHVFLVVKRNQVDFDKSTRKKLLNEGLWINNIANLK